MTANLKQVKQKAEALIEKYALTTPVQVFQLADLIGIKWKTCKTDELKKCITKAGNKASKQIETWEDVYGYYDAKLKTIYLNTENQQITRKRFTMAHEIAHETLHHDLSNLLDRVFMRQDIFSPRDTIEAEANYFAGYLLMPDREIEKKLKYTVLMMGGEQTITSFAKMFAVSPEAMRIRFKTFKKEHPELWKEYHMEEKLF